MSCGALWATAWPPIIPERVDGVVYIGPAVGSRPSRAASHPFDEALDTDEGWAKYNSHYWSRDYRGFLEFFFAQMFNEPHSSKQIEDCIGWGLETDPGDARRHDPGLGYRAEETFRELRARALPDARDSRRPGSGPAARAGRGARASDRGS